MGFEVTPPHFIKGLFRVYHGLWMSPPDILGMVPCDQNSLETHSLPIHSESHCLFSPCNKEFPGADVLVGPFG